MIRILPRVLACGLAALLSLTTTSRAGDWSNAGANAQRNGQTIEVGPESAQLLWSGAPSSLIAWQPVVAAGRVYIVRQTGFPPAGEPSGSPIVCLDLATGATLWTVHLPFNAGEWTTWVAGVSQGRLYASRSGNGASSKALVHCLDAATGATLWTSVDKIDAGPYDGVVFAADGDPIVASVTSIKRIDAATGATVWNATRLCSFSGNCGGALLGNAFYVADAVPGGHAIRRFDLTTGAFQYQGPTMSGFTLQNTPMVGPDGTIYLSRTQNSAPTDFFYAFTDSGAALNTKWSVPCGWSTSSEFAIGHEGSVYMLGPGRVIQRRDPATGALLSSSAPIGSSNVAPRLAADPLGNVYVGNGGFADGKLIALDAALAPRWSVSVPNINIGGPVIADDGTLVVAGIGTDLRAYRTARLLSVDTSSISGSSGGAQHFTLAAGAAQAGSLYLLLGSISGTLPGLAAGALVLPLNFDLYTQLTLSAPNSQFLIGTLGALDASGHASAQLALPAGLQLSSELTAYHAYVLLDPVALTVTQVSNPVGLVIRP